MHQDAAQACAISKILPPQAGIITPDNSNSIKPQHRRRKKNPKMPPEIYPEPYSFLKPYPVPQFFKHRRLAKTMLAIKWKDKVRYFYYGKKYKDITGESWGICSRLITIQDFNKKFRFITPDFTDEITRLVGAKKQCTVCGEHKYFVEFNYNPRLHNARFDRCIMCAIKDRDFYNLYASDIMSLDRSIKTNFIRYMQENPVYFKETFDIDPTPENLELAWDEAMHAKKEGGTLA